MAQYYGVTRTNEYLMHYGVKGMRWGVRKALSKKGDKRARALHKQYNRAKDYLVKLNKKANIGEQKVQQKTYAKRAGIGLGIGTLGTTGVIGANAYQKLLRNKYESAHDAFYKNMDSRILDYQKGPGHPAYWAAQKERDELDQKLKQAAKDWTNKGDIADKIKKASAIVDIAGFAYGGYAGARSLLAKHRTTPEGHAKAVAKRDAFEKEMKETFRNTPYSDPSYWAKADYKLNKKSYDRARKKRKKVNYDQKYD